MRAARPYGPDAFLLECAPGEAVDLHLRVDLPGVVQTVPGVSTLLVECVDAAAAREAQRRLQVIEVQHVERAAREHVLEVQYGGPDLGEVARRHGLTEHEVVTLHSASVLAVALTGFAPGFAYLAGLPEQLHTPRRAEPRAAVEAGSVGIGGPWTGVYPRRGPGGWHLLGSTETSLWDLDRDPPALLHLGDTVRFRAV